MAKTLNALAPLKKAIFVVSAQHEKIVVSHIFCTNH